MTRQTIVRELRVAFSPKAQPVWFRVLKWSVFVLLVRGYHRAKWFRAGVGGIFLAAVTLHLFYRWKT